MSQQIKLGALAIDIEFKNIKNVHLGVYPPHGRVRIAAPKGTSLDRIRVFAISQLSWIKKQQAKLREQLRETPREYLNRESHFVWGKRFLLKVVREEAPPFIELQHAKMILHVRPSASSDKCKAEVEQWYRDQIKKVAPRIIEKWEKILRLKVKAIYVQRMRTMWGSCSPARKAIRLNTDLAKKPRQCLEYIILHEMIHLIEPTHNARFVSLMDKHMPRWPLLRRRLNDLPVRHEEWGY
ncbi:MAG: M48 family metallopeptidase [Alphaproteobacteria bacterium]|nr:M48 family metallopeptidase [Alphaproteobacteria bacterium]